MKKIMMLLIVAVFMLGVAGNAMASFQDGELIRVVYSTNNGQGSEFATDLGAIGSYTDPSQITAPITVTAGAFTPGSVGQTDFSNMYVGYFIYDWTGANGHAWTSGPAGVNGFNGSNLSVFQGGAFTAASLWGSTGHTTFSNAESNASSYYNNLGPLNGGQGMMGGFLKSSADMKLDALNAGGAGYVDQVLYYYGSDPSLGGTPTAVAMLRTSADGSTTLSAATPIPAAVYLFGSGLMGLVGLRRKMSA